jgi:hypothetical protein
MQANSQKFRDIWVNIFDTPKTHFYINDCIVDFATGLIYKDGQIIWETANEILIWKNRFMSGDPRWRNRISRLEIVIERMKELTEYFENKLNTQDSINSINEGTSLHLLHPFGRYVFGHFFDTMQKLVTVEDERLNFESILLSKTNEIMNLEDHFLALGLANKKTIPNNSDLIKVSRLLFISPIAHPTTYTSESYQFLRKKYYGHFNIKKVRPSMKIFLTRRKGMFRRYLINSSDIEAKLAEENIIIYDGTESFSEAIRGFSSATHVAGVHGSLFANNIYGHEETKYLEFCPVGRIGNTFRTQYKLCHSYKQILLDGDSEHNISLDPNKLLAFYRS